MTPDALADLVDGVLGEALAALVDAGRPEPDRVYRSHGQPAWDLCATDTLVAYVANLQPSPGSGRPGCATVWRPEVHVQIIRCAPTVDDRGKAPAAGALDASAAGLLDDAWALASAAPFGLGCDAVTIGAARALGPAGGVAAWDLPLTVTVT